MDYGALETLRQAHPAWRLLRADHAPLIVSFLFRTFIQPNLRSLPQPELAARLDDHLHHVRARLADGDDRFPRPAAEYLDDWASDERAWLRKYYPADADEPHYDITPAAEKAIDWLAGLRDRQFVGTESRLMTVFALLRELVEGTQSDPAARIAELERRRTELDAEIRRIRDGQLMLMDATQVKDRFLQMAGTARGLLSDFRAVEQNFRDLDREVRERIATAEDGKGKLLEGIFGQRDAIADSDQGRSFRAFWDFLMSPARQEELSSLLQAVLALAPVKELAPDRRLLRIHYDWPEAGEVAQRTVARLPEQLRRYLDDQAWLENRRIMRLIRAVEQHALALRERSPDGPVMAIDEAAPEVDLAMDRPLFTPPFKPHLGGEAVPGDDDVPADALFAQVHIDKAQLALQIRRALQTRDQVSLAELVEAHPLEHGLAELVAYLGIAADSYRTAMIDDSRTQSVSWTDATGVMRRATVPLVVFSRQAAPADAAR